MNLSESLFSDFVRILQPEVDRRKAEQASDLAAGRTSQIAEKATLSKQAEKVAAAGAGRVEKAVSDVRKAQADLDTALGRLAETRRLAAGELWPLTTRLACIENELVATQPAAARAAVNRLLSKCGDAYRMIARVDGRSWSGEREILWSNIDQVSRRVAAIEAAIPEVRALATAVVDESDLESRFDAIVAGFPVVDSAPDQAVAS